MAVSPENAQIYLVITRLWVQFLALKKKPKASMLCHYAHVTDVNISIK